MSKTYIEIVSVSSLKDIATRSFEKAMSFNINLTDDELIEEFVTLQVKGAVLACDAVIANIQEIGIYNLPGCKMITIRVIANKKEKLYVATVVKTNGCDNCCYPNNKVAAKK